jgi:RimJ/RimL family protein N-acetyltransferase
MQSSGNVQIRPFQAGDAPPVFDAIQESQPLLSRWMRDMNASLTLEGVRSYIEQQPTMREQRKAFNFIIAEAQNPKTILGGCGLTAINWPHQFANLYYWVRGTRASQGIASAATLLLARFGFNQLQLARIEIVVAIGNPASIRVAEKVGAQREGLLRQRINIHGTVHDAWIYSLLPSDLS